MNHRRYSSSFRLIVLSFFLMILAGGILLSLPISSRQHVWTPFIDSIFTATSATCVTGLIVRDTATYWSWFGQLVILCLIQVGGMGVITMAVLIVSRIGKNVGLVQRKTMQDAISSPRLDNIVQLTRFIFHGAITLEVLGAVLMAPIYISERGILQGIWMSIFHSISAFCNAGFDVYGHYESLTAYAGNPIINIVIMALIVLGGLGFVVWKDVLDKKQHISKYNLQTKIVLLTTFFLIVGPAVYFYFGEYSDLSGGTRVLVSFFQSVTLRTAGFNTTDLSTLTGTGKMTMISMMLIGGSPGSTAGGMKTTTFVVILACVYAAFHQDHPHIFRRRISNESIQNAICIFTLYIVLFLICGMLISRIENIDIVSCLFETASAIGTVGLTLGITTKIGAASKIILILLMYFGRVGGLTLAYALTFRSRYTKALPVENVNVG